METDNGSTATSTLDLSLDQVHKRILKLMEQGHRSAYQIGRLYNYVVDSELAQKGGFKDARDFFQQRVKVLGQSVLSRNGAVARTFPETVALKYGVSNLYTLLTYAKLAGLSLEPGEPGDTPVTVFDKDGTPRPKSFAECTVEELQSAVKYKRTPPTPLSEQDSARVQRYRDNLQRHFTEKLGIRVDARSHMGQLFITLRDIPEKEMQRLAAALVDESTPLHLGVQAQGAAHRDTPVVPAPPVTQAPAMVHDDSASTPAAQVHGTAEDHAPLTGPARNDTSPVPAAPITQRDGAAHDNLSVPLTPARVAAHNDNPAPPAAHSPGAARGAPLPAPAIPVMQVPATAPPTVKNPGPDVTNPIQGMRVAQGQGGPRNRLQELSGLLRRMTGG